MMGEDIHLWS